MRILKTILHNAEGKISLTKLGIWGVMALQALKASNLIPAHYLPVAQAVEYFAAAVGLVGVRDAIGKKV